MRIILILSALAITSVCQAGSGGPLGIDSVIEKSDTGIWSRSNQKGLTAGSILVSVGGALMLGKENRLGRTFWKSTDAVVVTAITTQVMKYAFSRERPRDGANPDSWFQGDHNHSFPSGEVAGITAVVSPFMFEYGREYPAVYSLAVLPVYMSIARVKSQAHWQTDVIGGAVVGGLMGYYFYVRQESGSSLLFNLQPVDRGFLMGFQKSW